MKKCTKCKENEVTNTTNTWCSSCHKEAYKNNRDPYFTVYYLPEEHYVGSTFRLKRRMKLHENRNKNTNNWRILYVCDNEKEAAYYEAMFQSYLAIGGLPHKTKRQHERD